MVYAVVSQTHHVSQVAQSTLSIVLVFVGRYTGSDMLPKTNCTFYRQVMTVLCGIGMWPLRYAFSYEALFSNCSIVDFDVDVGFMCALVTGGRC